MSHVAKGSARGGWLWAERGRQNERPTISDGSFVRGAKVALVISAPTQPALKDSELFVPAPSAMPQSLSDRV